MAGVPASSHGVSGGAITTLFSSTLAAPASAIDSGAGGFSSALTVLTIYLLLRTNDAGNNSGAVNVTFNNDTGANYSQQSLSGNNAVAAAGASVARANWTANVSSAGDTANYASLIVITVPFYGAATFAKSCLAEELQPAAVAANSVAAIRPFVWGSTAAITRVTATSGTAGTFNTGSALLVVAS